MDAMEEAVGRAAEMGRPIHFTPGWAELTQLEASAMIAGIIIMGYVARIAARLGTRIITTCAKVTVYPLCVETVRQAFEVENKSDMFRLEDQMFLALDSTALGVMEREKIAANFLIGAFWASSLTLAEGGARVGAIGIGGCTTMHNIAFLVACMDYCLIGEEVFAASAYITKDPVQTSTVAGQDYIKIIILVLLVLGSILTTMGLPMLKQWMSLVCLPIISKFFGG